MRRRLVFSSQGVGDIATLGTDVGLAFSSIVGQDCQSLLGAPCTVAPAATSQQIATCNSGTYWFDPFCWSRSRDAWTQLAALPTIPSSVVAGPGVPDSALTAPYQPTQAEIDAAAGQAITQTQENVSDFIQTVPDNPIPAVPCTWMNISCTTLAIGGLVAFAALLMLRGGGR